MNDQPQADANEEAPLDRLLAEYLQRVDRGEPLDREQLIAANPELATGLRAFLQADDLVQTIVKPRSGIRENPGEQGSEFSRIPRQDKQDNSLPFRVLGDFELHHEIARGGMGIVYKARQVSLNRPVALKVLNAALGLTPHAVTRFRVEAETAARLHHTNIVAIYATGTEHGVYYYAMELIPGPSLDIVLRELRQIEERSRPQPAEAQSAKDNLPDWVNETLAHRPHDPAVQSPAPFAGSAGPASSGITNSSTLGEGNAYFDAVARMTADVADALDYAHKHGVIHRDMKPSNLLLSPEGRLSIADFGLARMLEQPGMTITGEFVGTPAYMSPEQITAGRVSVDHRTDVYSLGATLYELLTLQRPFPGERRDQVLAQILQKDPRPPRKVNRKIPHDLETICLKAMDKDPDRRYQAASQMADDLRNYLNRFAIKARRAGPIERARKWARRQPGLATGISVALLAVVLALFFGWQARQSASEVLVYLDEIVLQAVLNARFDDAEQAIADAAERGTSPTQLQTLQGLIAYFRGNTAEAIEKLETAVAMLPDKESAAARGLLALSYSRAGQIGDELRTLEELRPIAPQMPLDFLFKGAALAEWEPHEGLKLLDQAVGGKTKSASAVARLLRSSARMALAHDELDATWAGKALDDLAAANRLLDEGSSLAVLDACWIHQLAAAVYLANDDLAKHGQQLELAKQQADAVRADFSQATALHARWSVAWNFAAQDGNLHLNELRRLAGDPEFPNIGVACATTLYWQGDPRDLAEALQVLGQHPDDTVARLMHCCLLAETGQHQPAVDSCHRLFEGKLEGYHRLRAYALLLWLGKKELLKPLVERHLKEGLEFPPQRSRFFRNLMKFCGGSLSAAELEADALLSKSAWNRCLAHYFIALSRLADGDRAAARDQFQKALDTQAIGWLHYSLTKIFMKRMDDEQWPAWLQDKADGPK